MAKRLDDLAPQGLLDRARKAVDLVDAASRIRVSMAHALDRASADRLQAESNELLVVSDMGSAQLGLLERLPYPVVVLDHHKPVRDSDTVVHVNPHLDGVDGAREMCGATTTWLFTLVLDERNWDLAGIAMAGAIGDMQAAGGFVGVNGALFAEAADRKIVVPERRLSLRDLPLAKAIVQSIRPYFRGLSGRPDASAALLKKAGFDPDINLRQLESAARRKLTSVLAAHLVEQGAAPEALDAIVEDRYWIEPDQIYAQDLEAYVNSCDRLGQEGLGMAVCLGDREALAKAEGLLDQYVSRMLGYLTRLEREGLYAKKHIQFFYCDDASLSGSVAGTGMQFFFEQTRPVLALSVLDGQTKVSARATRGRIASGVDLAVALREAAASVGGNGGGHNIASGATIPKGKEDKFIGTVDEIVGRQLGSGSASQ